MKTEVKKKNILKLQACTSSSLGILKELLEGCHGSIQVHRCISINMAMTEKAHVS